VNTVLPRGIEYWNLTSGRGFAPGSSVPHATVDPFAAPMPAKVKAEQALHFAESLARGEPNR